MKKNLFIALALFMVSCNTEETFDYLSAKTGDVLPTKEEKAINSYIKQTKHISRSADINLLPIIHNGDTVMYVVNYDNGWEVFSNDERVPMVLFSSPQGSYYPGYVDNENPLMKLIDNCEGNLSVIKNQDYNDNKADFSWKLYSSGEGGDGSDIDEPGLMLWKVVGYYDSIVEVPHTPNGNRLRTKWDQGYGYNQFTPTYKDLPDVHTYVGCCAIAAGQYLYYTHYEYGKPLTTVTTATVDPSTANTPYKKYKFSGQSSIIWDEFENVDNHNEKYTLESMAPTAVFLGYVGQKIHTIYPDNAYAGSGSTMSNICSYIKSETSFKLAVSDYDFDNVISEINSGYPVITSVLNKKIDESGHVVLIDYYSRQYVYRTVYLAYIEGDYEDADDPFKIDYWTEYADCLNDGRVTLDDLEEWYGELTIEKVDKSYISFIKINWGWGGYEDEVEINPFALEWHLPMSNQVYYKPNSIIKHV